MVDSNFIHNVFENFLSTPTTHPLCRQFFSEASFGSSLRMYSTEQSNAAEPAIDQFSGARRFGLPEFSIHDLSRCQASQAEELFRLNMPFELGMVFWLARDMVGIHLDKVILILDENIVCKKRYPLAQEASWKRTTTNSP